MTQQIRNRALVGAAMLAASPLFAADHLDTPSVIADPRADIGDVFAWTSHDARRLNLVMTIVGHTFSEQLEYVFHIDSGRRFGQTNATTDIVCRIATAHNVFCKVGNADVASGDASDSKGLEGRNKHLRVFAGLRDDPFYNNVKGTREAYAVAADAMMGSAKNDVAGCPMFSEATARSILDTWRHTGGGPAKNFLVGWTPASLVVSVDLDVVDRGGTMLAVWATTANANKQIDRMGRPLTGNALLGSFSDEATSDRLKERYNGATPATGAEFIAEMERTLGIYDGFDGKCGNQLLADMKTASPARYRALATVLADDRLWVNSESTICGEFFSVEFAALAGQDAMMMYCGGRTPNDDAIDVYRSVLSMGQATGIDDGVDRDDHEHSITEFPFLAAP
ncbi:DUF4331 family protein [Peristeroidobacter soli]|jgi:hypothetical protein|uniref:DUF4331 family protein n=1 Tax=Peristeroidobacter soli TaxID=2497877 RepID=UPI00101D0345|nr:DUF4331 family protein [Peristeroidobacter soli]